MFGFDKVNRKTFSKNFLRRVIFQINFRTINLEEHKDKIIRFFGDKFPRITNKIGGSVQISFEKNQPEFQTSKESDGVILKSKSGDIHVEIAANNLTLSFNGNDYESFEKAKEYLNLVIRFLTDLKVKEISGYLSRKINIIEFEIDHAPNEVVYFLLNNSLIGNIDSFPKMEYINHNLQTINYAHNHYNLNLKYGMNIPPQIGEAKLGQVIIDIEMGTSKALPIKEFSMISEEINSEMFNVFNWIASDNLKKILND